jgi:6-phosphogluconolactonase
MGPHRRRKSRDVCTPEGGLFVTSFVFTGSLTRPAPNYREANGKGISTLRLDPESGQLTEVAVFSGIDDTSWLTLDPSRRRLYAVCEEPGGDQSLVASFAVDEAGKLSEINRVKTGGQTACHMSLTPDRRFLLVANYNAIVPQGAADGAIAVFPIGEKGELLQASSLIHHEGSGPNKARQERSHAHCILPSPDGRFVYVTDLGMDRIFVYALARDGKLTQRPASDFSVGPGIGPRHLAFAPDGRRLFMVSELTPTVMSFAVDTATGALAELDRFAIARLGEKIVQPAGILRSSARYLFAGLRECDEILGLSVDPASGKLGQTGRWSSGGGTPRDFAFSPDGRYLIVTNQDSDRVTVFPVSGGTLGAPVQNLAVGTPMAIAIAEL